MEAKITSGEIPTIKLNDAVRKTNDMLILDNERLKKVMVWALGVLESLPWDEMTTANEGGQGFIDEFRRKAGIE